MAENLAYNYAEIDLTTGMCVGVHTGSAEEISDIMIPIPVYSTDYIFKYYINGNWYEDAAGTIPWTPPTE